uniref:Uncharacterized protein n=1 Tax=Rangifer tarandus platyrhynchus TaxID=3082113 RepID=A0ACB0DPR8_RANTA|nr:unnamed protein product [Rangifer tarandus platyrhynchus]
MLQGRFDPLESCSGPGQSPKATLVLTASRLSPLLSGSGPAYHPPKIPPSLASPFWAISVGVPPGVLTSSPTAPHRSAPLRAPGSRSDLPRVLSPVSPPEPLPLPWPPRPQVTQGSFPASPLSSPGSILSVLRGPCRSPEAGFGAPWADSCGAGVCLRSPRPHFPRFPTGRAPTAARPAPLSPADMLSSAPSDRGKAAPRLEQTLGGTPPSAEPPTQEVRRQQASAPRMVLQEAILRESPGAFTRLRLVYHHRLGFLE